MAPNPTYEASYLAWFVKLWVVLLLLLFQNTSKYVYMCIYVCVYTCVCVYVCVCAGLCLVTLSSPTRCDPMDCNPPRLLCPWGFSRQEYCSGLPCPPPGDFPKPGIEPRFPVMQVDSLPSEPPGEPKNTGMNSLSLLFLTQESNQGLLHCRRIL